MIGFGGNFARRRLFNWITIVLVTAWVGLVTIVAEHSQGGERAVMKQTPHEFIEQMAR